MNYDLEQYLESCLSKAEDLMAEERWEEAINNVDIVLKENHANQRAKELHEILSNIVQRGEEFRYLVRTAEFLQLKNRTKDALKFWEKALLLKPDDDRALAFIKKCRESIETQENLTNLKKEAEKCLENGDFNQTHNLLDQLEELNADKSFIAWLRTEAERRERWKRRVDGIIIRGKEAHQRGDLNAALVLLEHAAEVDETQNEEITDLINLIRKEIETQKMEDAFNKRYKMIEHLHAVGRFQESWEEAEKLLTEFPEKTELRILARKALNSLESQTSADDLLQKAEQCFNEGNYEKAASIWESVNMLFPEKGELKRLIEKARILAQRLTDDSF